MILLREGGEGELTVQEFARGAKATDRRHDANETDHPSADKQNKRCHYCVKDRKGECYISNQASLFFNMQIAKVCKP